jgi:hypothetical protein
LIKSWHGAQCRFEYITTKSLKEGFIIFLGAAFEIVNTVHYFRFWNFLEFFGFFVLFCTLDPLCGMVVRQNCKENMNWNVGIGHKVPIMLFICRAELELQLK